MRQVGSSSLKEASLISLHRIELFAEISPVCCRFGECIWPREEPRTSIHLVSLEWFASYLNNARLTSLSICCCSVRRASESSPEGNCVSSGPVASQAMGSGSVWATLGEGLSGFQYANVA